MTHRFKTPLAFALTTALGLTTVSCGQLGQLGDLLAPYTPKMSFNKLELNSIDFEKIDVDFKFNVANPNPVSVKLAQFGYALGLEGVEFVKGRNTDGFQLKSKGDTELAIPVGLKFADIFKLVQNVDGKDDIGFSIAGDFGFDTPVGMATVPFREEGRFPVVRAPNVSLKGARVKEVNLLKNKASLAVDLGFANPKGGSAISFAGFNYALTMAGKPIAGGVLETVAGVAGGGEQVVSLPIDLNLLQLGSSVVKLVQGKSAADLGLTGTVQIGTPFGTIPLDIAQVGSFLLK
jgi:LEA14-like dessication related protein